MSSPKISNVVKKQLPEFIQSDYETFVSFLEAYYEYLESPGNAGNSLDQILSYQDADTTIEEFSRHLFHNFMHGFPHDLIRDNTNESTIIKRIREFYLAKGTKKSYEFLFRVLFQKTPTLYFPKNDILRTSASAWDLYQYVFLYTDGSIENDAIGKKLTGEDSEQYAFIQSIKLQTYKHQDQNVYQVFISNPTGEFDPGEYVSIPGEDFLISIGSSITSVDIIDPGKNYDIGEKFAISTEGDGAVIEVCDVSVGIVESLLIVSGGYGYLPGDTINISGPSSPGKPAQAFIKETDSSGKITKINLVSGGYGYTELPEAEVNPNSSGTGASLLPYSETIGSVTRIKLVNPGVGYDVSTTISPTSGNSSGDFAVGISTIGSQYKYTTKKSHLNTNKVLQDSLYWQDFSYEITVELEIAKYRDFVKHLVHPAGLKMFGSFLIVVDENASKANEEPTAAATLDLIRKTFIEDAGIQSVDQYIEIILGIMSFVEDHEVNLGPTYASLERLKFKFTPEERFQRRVTTRDKTRDLKVPYNYYSPVESNSNENSINNRASTTLGNHIDPIKGMIPTNDCMLYDVINYPGIQTSLAPNSETHVSRSYRYSLKKNSVFLVDSGLLQL